MSPSHVTKGTLVKENWMFLLLQDWTHHCCLVLKHRNQLSLPTLSKGVGFVQADPCIVKPGCGDKIPDPCFETFISKALVSLTDSPSDQNWICTLRDTGRSQSIILAKALQFSSKNIYGFNTLLRGIEMGYVPRTLHHIYIQSKFVRLFSCCLLAINGVTMLLGNNIAGGLVLPNIEIFDKPLNQVGPNSTFSNLDLYPACVVICARSKKDCNF